MLADETKLKREKKLPSAKLKKTKQIQYNNKHKKIFNKKKGNSAANCRSKSDRLSKKQSKRKVSAYRGLCPESRRLKAADDERSSPPSPLSGTLGGRGRAPMPTEGTLSTERPLFQNSPLDCFGIHPLQRSERFGEFRRLRPPTKGAAFGNRKPLKRLDLNFDWLRTADSLT